MFSDKIVDTDAFLDMGAGSQLLYFHLCMRADDDGFVSNPKKIMRMIGSQEDDFKILLAKRFVLQFESGVCVIKHWLIHNLLRNDRYKETQYVKEKKMLAVDKETKKYSLIKPKDEYWQPNGNQMAPQVRLGKVRLTTGGENFSEKIIPPRVLLDKKGKPISLVSGNEYVADGWSPKQEMDMRRKIARSIGEKKSTVWSQLLMGSVWDFKKAFKHFLKREYASPISFEQTAKVMSTWYEQGETRETIRELILAFFTSEKAKNITITPNSVFSAHTYESWKQGQLVEKVDKNSKSEMLKSWGHK